MFAAGYDITSPDTSFKPESYNCIGWAANDVNHGFWWPMYGYWPFWVKRELTVACFVRTFRWFGYRLCDNSRLEYGYEKVALYALHGVPTHMARQLRDGSWTSKLGDWEDIMHITLDALESYGPIPFGAYGAPILFMKRWIPVSWVVKGLQQFTWKIKVLTQR